MTNKADSIRGIHSPVLPAPSARIVILPPWKGLHESSHNRQAAERSDTSAHHGSTSTFNGRSCTRGSQSWTRHWQRQKFK